MTISAIPFSFSTRSFIALPPSISTFSVGFSAPKSTFRLIPLSSNEYSASSSVPWPVSTSLRPGLFSRTPKIPWSVGARRSQSTRITRLPRCAMEIARLTDTVDFPSPGTEDVTISVFACFFSISRSTRVRMRRSEST